MKIQTEQTHALQQTEIRRKTDQTPEGFEVLLAQQMEAEKGRGPAPGAEAGDVARGLAPPALTERILPSAPAIREEEAAIASRMEDLFSGLEGYARQLAADSPDALRSAYALLEGTAGEIASLKSAYPDMAQRQPVLAAMVNELEILAGNETFKFNRGDYL
jgi:hypothetical protein